MLGLIIGVVVTLLFTTKRGRELFKRATEQGLSKFADLEQQIKKTGALLEDPDEDDYIDEEEREILRPVTKEEKEESKPHVHHHENEEEAAHAEHKTHRFFKKKS